MRKNILITAVGGPAGINISKLLKKQSKYFKTFGTDINNNSAGQFFVDKFDICEKVTVEKKYLDWMKKYIIKNKIDVVLPTLAEELVLLEKLQKLIPKNVKVVVSGHKVLELCDEKDKLYSWMDNNLPEYMGKWILLNSKKKLWKSDKYFIKPIKGRGSRGCRLVSSKELNFLLKNDKDISNFIAMEVLPGKEWTTDVYVNDDGTFAYIVPRLRLGLSGGISQIGRTDNRKDVIEQTKILFEKLSSLDKIFGPVFVQWKEDTNGKPKMVELNPRASGALTITALSGADTAMVLKKEIIDKKPCTNLKWKEVTVTRYFEEKVV